MATADHELHRRIDAIEDAAADREALVSVAVAHDERVGDALERVESDRIEAVQLDEANLSRPLRTALERAGSLLEEYDETPENGLAVYAGVVDGDTVEYVFDDLPVPIDEGTYDRANEFDLEPIEDVTTPPTTTGLLVVERGGAALGRTVGDRVEAIGTVESDVPGKSSAGGQSADRFERERKRQKEAFFGTVAEEAKRAFLGDEPVESLVLGGTTVTVDEFRRGEYLDHRLADRLAGDTFAVEYATEQGLRQLADEASEALEERDRSEARAALDRFFDGLGDEEVAYGPDEVEDALEYDAVETALLSTALRGSVVHELGERSTKQGGDPVIVPDDFEDGRRFAEAFDGVGAILRFPIE